MSFALPQSLPDLSATPDELNARRRARFVSPLLNAAASQPGNRIFKLVSLEQWAEEAAAAGIPAVPAEVVCRIPVDVIMNFEEPRAGDESHWKALTAARASLQLGEMLRWDCCAGLEMKMVMQVGAGGSDVGSRDPVNSGVPAWRSALTPDDPRLFDLAYEYPGDEIPVLRRPWVDARMEGSHPAEYRVFIREGEVIGVANYYVQRPMALNETIRTEVLKAISLSEQLLASMQSRKAYPFVSPKFKLEAICCTLDFLVTKEGETLFLEAGPPFGLGAHPCAFVENKFDGFISVDGVALEAGKTPIDMEEFKAMVSSPTKPRANKP